MDARTDRIRTDAGNNAERLRSLEMLRAVAALLVVLFHTGSILAARTGRDVFFSAFANGNRGVDLFFVLSGFVIAHAHRRDWGRPQRLRSYLFNRAARIYPSVWIVSALALASYLAGSRLGVTVGLGAADPVRRLGGWDILASVLLLPQHDVPLVNVTWTLKSEMFFYAVFALLIVERRSLAVLVGWQAAVAGCVLADCSFDTSWGHICLGPGGLEFGVGIACAWLVRRRDRVPPLTRRALPLAALLLGAVTFAGGEMVEAHWSGRSGVPDFVVYGLGSGLIVGSLALLDVSGRLRSWRPLANLGEASYSIYLVHFSAITLVSRAMLTCWPVPVGVAFGLTVAGVGVLAGAGFHHLVDRPIQRRLRAFRSHVSGLGAPEPDRPTGRDVDGMASAMARRP